MNRSSATTSISGWAAEHAKNVSLPVHAPGYETLYVPIASEFG